MASIFKSQLAKRVGKKIGWNFKKTLRSIEQVEEIICEELNKKDRVKLQNFGTFYLVRQGSRSIIQVRSKQRRILLDNVIIKFRPSLKIRKNLTIVEGQSNQENKAIPAPKEQSETDNQVSISSEEISIPIQLIKSQEENSSKQETQMKENAEKIEDQTHKPQVPKRTFERVSKERAQEILSRRLRYLDQNNKQLPQNFTTNRFLEETSGGKFFDLALRKLEKTGFDSLNLYFDAKANFCRIIMGKNRSIPLQAPRNLIENILIDHLEIVDFDFPQERFVKLHSSSKMDKGWIVSVHSLPLERELSVYVKIVKRI